MPTVSPLDDDLFLVDVVDDKTNRVATTLSFSRSPTVSLTFAANRFTRQAARYYQQEFGIGAMDWRMLVMLTREPGASVAQASKTIGIDKGAVSRSLSRLEKVGLVTATSALSDERRKSWHLTEAGQQLHGRMLKGALARQQQLLAGFEQHEVEQFNDYLQRFLVNLENL